MGQWVVSVPGLEPLQLRAALTSRGALVTGISDPKPGEVPKGRVNRMQGTGPGKVHHNPAQTMTGGIQAGRQARRPRRERVRGWRTWPVRDGWRRERRWRSRRPRDGRPHRSLPCQDPPLLTPWPGNQRLASGPPLASAFCRTWKTSAVYASTAG